MTTCGRQDKQGNHYIIPIVLLETWDTLMSKENYWEYDAFDLIEKCRVIK